MDHCDGHSKGHKNYPCTFGKCHIVKKSAQSFNRHIREHKEAENPRSTKTVPKTVNVPPRPIFLRCSHCATLFDRYADFNKHVRNLNPFRLDCPCCVRRDFYTLGALRSHLKRYVYAFRLSQTFKYTKSSSYSRCIIVILFRSHPTIQSRVNKTSSEDNNAAVTEGDDAVVSVEGVDGDTDGDTAADDDGVVAVEGIGGDTAAGDAHDAADNDDKDDAGHDAESIAVNTPPVEAANGVPVTYEHFEHEMEYELVAKLKQNQEHYGLPQAGIDSILNTFRQAIESSRDRLDAFLVNHVSPDVLKRSRENDALHNILTQERIATASKRQFRFQKLGLLLPQRRLRLGTNELGELRISHYCHPRELLQRFFDDATVVSSFKAQQRSIIENGSKTHHTYSDIFRSTYFQDVWNTVPSQDNVRPAPPLVLGLYSDGFDPRDPMRSKGRHAVVACYIFCLNLLPHHRGKRETFLTTLVISSADVKSFGFNECFFRLVVDINSLIETGFEVDGQTYAVRVGQIRADNLEKNKIFGIGESFSKCTYFSTYSYISQEARQNATCAADLAPSNFGLRDKAGYQQDVEAIEKGLESRGLKANSVVNKIAYFHCAETGSSVPCVMHDVYCGFARTDMLLILQELFRRNILSRGEFAKLNKDFKQKLHGSDRSSWLAKLRIDTQTTKLPGTIVQNLKFIQYASVLLWNKVQSQKAVLSTDIWRLYRLLKRICELLNAEHMSEAQVVELNDKYLDYLDIRISLSKDSEINETVVSTDEENSDEEKACNRTKPRRRSNKVWPAISPKHTFVCHYPSIIRRVGCVSLLHTNRAESKNGQLKRRTRMANNSRNVPLTVLRADNEFHASNALSGAFTDPLVQVPNSITLSQQDDVYDWLQEQHGEFFSVNYTFASQVTYKQQRYTTDQVLITGATEESTDFGQIQNFSICHTEHGTQVNAVCMHLKSSYCEEMGVYITSPTNKSYFLQDLSTLLVFQPLAIVTFRDLTGRDVNVISLKNDPLRL